MDSKGQLTLCIVLLFTVTVAAQQHAPTKGQCDADLKFWNADLITGSQGEWALRNDAKVGFLEVMDRTREMGDCERTYVSEKQLGSGPYAELAKVLDSLLETRMIGFMKRHPEILKQFLEEDTSGVR
jgi:hypothetical protein